MLLFLGWLFALLALVVFVVGGFAAGMASTANAVNPGKWVAIVCALLAAVCFVARYFLRGRSIT